MERGAGKKGASGQETSVRNRPGRTAIARGNKVKNSDRRARKGSERKGIARLVPPRKTIRIKGGGEPSPPTKQESKTNNNDQNVSPGKEKK